MRHRIRIATSTYAWSSAGCAIVSSLYLRDTFPSWPRVRMQSFSMCLLHRLLTMAALTSLNCFGVYTIVAPPYSSHLQGVRLPHPPRTSASVHHTSSSNRVIECEREFPLSPTIHLRKYRMHLEWQHVELAFQLSMHVLCMHACAPAVAAGGSCRRARPGAGHCSCSCSCRLQLA